MSISRRKAVERARKKQLKETMEWVMLPATIVSAVLPKKKKKRRKRKIF